MVEHDTQADDRYVPTASPRADDRTRILKHDDAFAVFDRFGDVDPNGPPELGIYERDTRHLSRLGLLLNGQRPLLLSSDVRDDNGALRVDLMNPELPDPDGSVLPRGTIHLRRTTLLWRSTCHQRLELRNYGSARLQVAVQLAVEADFADLFEVRGMDRARRGDMQAAESGPDRIRLGYVGLDGVERATVIIFDPAPAAVHAGGAEFTLDLGPGQAARLEIAIRCERGTGTGPASSFTDAGASVDASIAVARAKEVEVVTSEPAFTAWLARSLDDLRMLRTETPHGPYPYAGVPWFSAPFGRDGILAALEYLWVDPAIGRGVLAYLSATQADADRPEVDAEPGKILHEARMGEMSALGEVPFAAYYGSMDATPLFVMLAGAYHRVTADLDTLAATWPHIERALEWMDTSGDPDGDGLLEYVRRSPQGLPHQGWRDAHDAVFTREGSLATGPIALAEVQGYAYAARSAAAELALAMGRPERAEALRAAAVALRDRFDEAFWCDDLGTYAMALDGRKQPCRVRASNAGHCLYSGIVRPERASSAARVLMDPASFSGWGIRTVATGAARYSPIAYHNGSVWPHDSALVGAGLARYGYRADAARILAGLFDASRHFDRGRMPELFCGFDRETGLPPTRYPVACAPQAWAAAAPFLLLQACLGLELDGGAGEVRLSGATLPIGLDEVVLRRLRAGPATADVAIRRVGREIGVEQLDGDARVTVTPDA